MPKWSPKPGPWVPGGPHFGSCPPGSASTPRRSRRPTSGTPAAPTRRTRRWRAPTPPTAAARTARRWDPAAPTHGLTATPGLVATGPPGPRHRRRRGPARGRAWPAAPGLGLGARGHLAPLLLAAGMGGTPLRHRAAASPQPPPRSQRGVPVSLRPPSPAPPPPKKPAPRCLAGKTSPAAAGARSPMLGALPPNPRARGSGGGPAAPSGSRGAPSVPCPPTTATTPAGRTAGGQEEEVREPRAGGAGCPRWVWGPDIALWLQGHCHSPGLSPLGMLPGCPGRSRMGARHLGEW